MASVEELIIKLSADNSDLKRKLADSEKGVQNFGGAVNKLGPMIAGAFSVAAITAFAGAAYRASEEQEKANRRLNFALQGNQKAFKDLVAQANQLQSTTAVADDVIMQIQTLAAQSGKTTAEIKKITEATVNLASATGQDLQSVYLQLNQTLTGTAGRLGRIDSDFLTLTEDQLKNGDAIDLVLQKYSGFAEESASSVDKLKTNWEEFKEKVGKWIGDTFNPSLERMNNLMAGKGYLNWNYGGGMEVIDMTKRGDLLENVNKEVEQTPMEYWVKQWEELLRIDKERAELAKKRREEEERILVLETRKREEIDKYNIPQSTFASAMGATGPGTIAGKGITPGKGGLFARSVTGGSAAEGAAITEMNLKLEQQIGIVNDLSQAFSDLAANGEVSMKGLTMIVLGEIRKIIMAHLAEAISGQVSSNSKFGLPGLAMAAIGISAVMGMFAKLPKFQTGGIVGGSSFAGDGITARVNSGEMILNTSQQAQLFAMANGGGARSMEVYGRIKAGDIYLSNKRGAYLSKRRGS